MFRSSDHLYRISHMLSEAAVVHPDAFITSAMAMLIPYVDYSHGASALCKMVHMLDSTFMHRSY